MAKWTSERPKREGYYWLYFEGHAPTMVKLVVDDEDNSLLVYYFGEEYPEFLSEDKFDKASWQKVADFDDCKDDRIARIEKEIAELRNRPQNVFVHGNNWGAPNNVDWSMPDVVRGTRTAGEPQYRDYWGGWLPPGVVPQYRDSCGGWLPPGVVPDRTTASASLTAGTAILPDQLDQYGNIKPKLQSGDSNG